MARDRERNMEIVEHWAKCELCDDEERSWNIRDLARLSWRRGVSHARFGG